MRRDRLLLSLFALSIPLLGYSAPARSTSPQETLQLRRIAEYWKEGDYAAAKTQILDLLSNRPNCKAKEQLYTMLGDLYFFENNYRAAVDAYSQVQEKDLQKKCQLNHLRSLFGMNQYSVVIKETAKELQEKGGERFELHYLLAESLWRQGMQTQDEQKKELLLKKAKQEYSGLVKSKFKDASLLPLAHIHRELKEYPEAADLLLQLAQKHPDKKEDLLFQAACVQVHVDTEAACKTFGCVYKMNGKRAKAAAYNHLLILFQSEKYAELLTAQEEAMRYLPPEKAAQIQFYIGKSHFALKDYKQAISSLQAFIGQKNSASPELKSALVCLVNCAKETRDLSLMSRAVQKMGEFFPRDPDYAQTLILHAQAHEQSGNFAAAHEQLQKVLLSFPEHQERETLSYEQARVLLKAQKWDQGRLAFMEFLHSYPESDLVSQAWHQLIHAGLMERKFAKEEELQHKNEMLVALLNEALEQSHVWKSEERDTYSFLLGKTLYSLGRWEESTTKLNAYLDDFSSSVSAPEAHLLIALAEHKVGHEGEPFFTHAEKALTMNPQLENRSLLRLMLYNAYLKEAAKNTGSVELIEKAADHLYACAVDGDVEVKKDNLLWLANYYYGRAKEENSSTFSTRAVALFERILKHLKAISCETLYLEGEVLKHADLLTFLGRPQEALVFLGELKSLYDAHPHLLWKFQRRALLELGRAYAQVKDYEKALHTYDHLITTSSHTASSAADVALLERARLEYGLLKNEEKSDANPRLSSILAALKDLQIKKRLNTEPIHLEAALDYAMIKSELAPQEKRLEKLLSLLKNLKEEFLSEEDPEGQEYQACRLRISEKDHLFKTYMKFIDALILQTQASQTENAEEASALKAKAQTLLDELNSSASNLTPYLREKLQKTTSL